MDVYLEDIATGLVVFPAAAFLFTIPYAIFSYRKYGAMPIMRVIIVYSFILYLICAYCMVVLPLPTIAEVAAAPAASANFVPFDFVKSIAKDSGLVISDFSTYLPALKTSSVYVVLFNMLLTLPLGMYFGYYFRRKWYQTLLLCFGMSLFYELTQLSGLYWIYPHAYRMFDVDDLIVNTFGGMLGFWLSPLAAKILPTREELDDIAYGKGRRVSLTRRTAAMIADMFLVGLGVTGLELLESLVTGEWAQRLAVVSFVLNYGVMMFIVFILIPTLTHGRTPGKACVGLRLVGAQGVRPAFWRYLVRYVLLYGVILALPFWAMFLAVMGGSLSGVLALALGAFGLIIYVVFGVRLIKTAVTKRNCFWYEKISGITNTSTVRRAKA